MKAIIDGDIPIFTECAVAAGKGSDFGPYFPNITGLADAASYTIEMWMRESGATELILVHGHKSKRNFRKHLMPGEYKAGRTQPKPSGYYEVLEKVLDRFDCFTIDGVEGDDACGILHTSTMTGETVTVSTDKDFKTLYGWHYNPNKHHLPEFISVNEAAHFWMWQVLVGDSADGYKGAKGIGKVKADAVLGVVDLTADAKVYACALWCAVLDAYVGVYSDPQTAMSNAVMQARMARILHREDYARENASIRLWNPHQTDEWLRLDSW